MDEPSRKRSSPWPMTVLLAAMLLIPLGAAAVGLAVGQSIRRERARQTPRSGLRQLSPAAIRIYYGDYDDGVTMWAW